jgi:hypothetical protein
MIFVRHYYQQNFMTDTRLVFCNRKLMRTDIFCTRTTKPICNFMNPGKWISFIKHTKNPLKIIFIVIYMYVYCFCPKMIRIWIVVPWLDRIFVTIDYKKMAKLVPFSNKQIYGSNAAISVFWYKICNKGEKSILTMHKN